MKPGRQRASGSGPPSPEASGLGADGRLRHRESLRGYQWIQSELPKLGYRVSAATARRVRRDLKIPRRRTNQKASGWHAALASGVNQDQGDGDGEGEDAEGYAKPAHHGQARLGRYGEHNGGRGRGRGEPAHQSYLGPPATVGQTPGRSEFHVSRLAGREGDDLLFREGTGVGVAWAAGQAHGTAEVDGPPAGVVHVGDHGGPAAG